VGIDGGDVRAAHKEGWFEVIAGRSVVAFPRWENEEVRQPNVSAWCSAMTRNHAGDCGK